MAATGCTRYIRRDLPLITVRSGKLQESASVARPRSNLARCRWVISYTTRDFLVSGVSTRLADQGNDGSGCPGCHGTSRLFSPSLVSNPGDGLVGSCSTSCGPHNKVCLTATPATRRAQRAARDSVRLREPVRRGDPVGGRGGTDRPTPPCARHCGRGHLRGTA